MPFFLSRGRGLFGLRRRTHGGASTPRTASWSFSHSSTSSGGVGHGHRRRRSRSSSSSPSNKNCWFVFDIPAKQRLTEPSVDTSTARTERDDGSPPIDSLGPTTILNLPISGVHSPDDGITVFSERCTSPSGADTIMQRFERDNHAAYHAALSATKRPRRSVSSSTVASEPIDIPHSPSLRDADDSAYLEVRDFSEDQAAANSVWSSAFSPTEPPAHMLKWAAMAMRNGSSSGAEKAKADEGEDSDLDEDARARVASLDGTLPEDNMFEMDM